MKISEFIDFLKQLPQDKLITYIKLTNIKEIKDLVVTNEETIEITD
jgi:hypothetical protein